MKCFFKDKLYLPADKAIRSENTSMCYSRGYGQTTLFLYLEDLLWILCRKRNVLMPNGKCRVTAAKHTVNHENKWYTDECKEVGKKYIFKKYKNKQSTRIE